MTSQLNSRPEVTAHVSGLLSIAGEKLPTTPRAISSLCFFSVGNLLENIPNERVYVLLLGKVNVCIHETTEPFFEQTELEVYHAIAEMGRHRLEDLRMVKQNAKDLA